MREYKTRAWVTSVGKILEMVRLNHHWLTSGYNLKEKLRLSVYCEFVDSVTKWIWAGPLYWYPGLLARADSFLCLPVSNLVLGITSIGKVAGQ